MRHWRLWTGWGLTLVALPAVSAQAFGPNALWPWFAVLAGAYGCAGLIYGFQSVHRVVWYSFNHSTEGDMTPLVKYLVLLARKGKNMDAWPMWEGPADSLIDFAMKLHHERLLPNETVGRLIEQKAQAMAELWNNKAELITRLAQWPLIFGLGCSFVTLVFGFMNLNQASLDLTNSAYMVFGMMSVVAGLCCSYLLFAPLVENFREGARHEVLKAKLIAHALPLVAKGANPVLLLEELNSLLSGPEVPPWEEILEAMKERAA